MADLTEQALKTWLRGAKKVVVAGVGNPIRTDDYVGLKVAQNLQGKLPQTVLLLEAETVPESYLQDIEDFAPTHVLLIDAANMGLKPGEFCLVNAQALVDTSAVSTHLLPLRIFCEYLRQATGAKIALLLVEPQSMEFGEGLTSPVEAAAEKLTELLIRLLG